MMARLLLLDSRSGRKLPGTHMTAGSDLIITKIPLHSKLLLISLQERGLLQNAVRSQEEVHGS